MFKTAYNAMMQNIAPTESTCQQVLAAMQAEEARQMPTILPVKRAETRRPVWTLVACAAMVTVAVALTWVLMKGEKPPMLPATPPTVGTESSTVTTTVTTTVENEIAPPSVTEPSVPSQSTTVTVTEPVQTTTKTTTTTTTTTTSTVTTTTATTAEQPTTVIGTLPTVGGYEDLFPWVETFTTEGAFKGEPTTASPTTEADTDKGTVSPITSTTGRPSMSIIPTPSVTTMNKTSSTTTTTQAMGTRPTQPFHGEVSYQDKTTSNTSQENETVTAQLKEGKVALFPLVFTEDETTTVVKPPLGNGSVIKEFALYGDRLVIIAGEKNPGYSDKTRVFVYNIENPSSPQLLGEIRQDGYFTAAHLKDGTLYLVSYYAPSAVHPERPETYVPRIYRQNVYTLLAPEQILRAPQPTCNGYTVITAISVADAPTVTSALALYGQANKLVSVYDTAVSVLSKPYLNQQNQSVTDRVNIAWDKGQIYFISRTTEEE